MISPVSISVGALHVFANSMISEISLLTFCKIEEIPSPLCQKDID